jgi:prepilin peptidase CpaA
MECSVEVATLQFTGHISLTLGVVVLSVAALHDVAARTVPNWMALAIALMGLITRVSDGTGVSAVVAGMSVFLAAAFCWRRGWMGGGDVKLLGAVVTLVPPHAVFTLLAFTAFAGGALALFYLAGRMLFGSRNKNLSCQRPATLPARVLRAEVWRIRRGGPLPYACAIAAGALITLFQTGV